MPFQRTLGDGQLLRPLLQVSRQTIKAYARKHQLSWIEDDSNTDERFSRNYLRHSLLPQIEQRWPGVSGRITGLAEEVLEANSRLLAETEQVLNDCVETHPQWLLNHKPLLLIERVLQLEPALQRQVVRQWLKRQGYKMPGRQVLQRIFVELIGARDDAGPVIHNAQYSLRRFRGYLLADAPKVYCDYVPEMWDWRTHSKRVLPDGRHLTVQVTNDDCPLTVALPNQPLCIKWRKHLDTSMKVAVAGRTGRKTIKRWLQEYNVPPWLRDDIPFLCAGEQLVAVPELWVCEGYQSQGQGYHIKWF